MTKFRDEKGKGVECDKIREGGPQTECGQGPGGEEKKTTKKDT